MGGGMERRRAAGEVGGEKHLVEAEDAVQRLVQVLLVTVPVPGDVLPHLRPRPPPPPLGLGPPPYRPNCPFPGKSDIQAWNLLACPFPGESDMQAWNLVLTKRLRNRRGGSCKVPRRGQP